MVTPTPVPPPAPTPPREHWRVTAIGRGPAKSLALLGECDNGDLWVPSKRRENWWDRRFSPWNPLHWRYWLRSRLTRRIVFLDPS